MRRMTVAAMILLLVCPVQGRQTVEEKRRVQVAAATSSAVQALYDEIARQQLVRTHTVGTFLEQTEGRDDLMKLLQRAEQIGGPRWLDEHTCQVHLEIAGSQVSRALAEIAAAEQSRSPVTGVELLPRLRDWDERTFSATGTSTGAERVEQLRPGPADEAWGGVSDGARRAAVLEAWRQAMANAIENVRPLRLAEDLTVSEVLERTPPARAALQKWLAEQPLTGIRFKEDLQVEMTVAVSAEPAIEALQAILAVHTEVGPERVDWDAVQEHLEQHPADGVGHGTAPINGAAIRANGIELPRQAPAWAGEEIHADAVATFVESRLKTARVAESEALARLQREVRELPLSETLTVGEAAERDPNIKASLERALARAHAEPPDYNHGGTEDVRVRVTLSLRHVWDELRGQ